MKKHLIAAAVATAITVPAMAQSSVEIYGILDQGIDSYKAELGSTTVKSTTTGKSSAYTSQRLGFRGVESINSGLKAFFNLEMGVGNLNEQVSSVGSGTDNAAPFTARTAFAGLEGGFGRIAVGRMTTLADAALINGDVGGANNFYGRLYTSGVKLNNSRSSRLVEYTSPSLSGLTLAVQYGNRKDSNNNGGAANAASTFYNSTTAIDGGNQQTEYGLSARYAVGALDIAYAYNEIKFGADTSNVAAAAYFDGKVKQHVIGGNYNFGPAKVFLTAVDGNVTTSNATNAIGIPAPKLLGIALNTGTFNGIDVDTNAYEAGLSVPLGALVLNASYFDGKVKDVDGKVKLSGYQAAGLYNLSKRTMLYAVYGKAKADLKDVPGVSLDADVTQYGVGVRHMF